MWRAGLISLAVLTGCPLPEDTFVLSGHTEPGAEVTLSRNRFASDTRCDAFEVLDVTHADDSGNYAFPVIRQQVTGGIEARRFFSVSAPRQGGTLTQRFWFPDADLDLGELEVPFEGSWTTSEGRLDGHVAWRADSNFGFAIPLDRTYEQHVVQSVREWRTVAVDSLGRFDVVPVESRFESVLTTHGAGIQVPRGRGAECPFIDVKPCPLTDGRFLPYFFPPETPQIILNFGRETSVKDLAFHGLVLARPAVKARFDFNFVVDYTQWNPMISAKLDGRAQVLSGDQCDEPGAFLKVSAQGFADPVLFRVTFEDAEGLTVPIVSLQELTVR